MLQGSLTLTRLMPFPSRGPLSPASNWDSDELTLKNELKLIDDSYYRVYDDNDYEIWKERMMSVIVKLLSICIVSFLLFLGKPV